MDTFFEKNAAALTAFTRMSAQAGARADYVQGGGGNTSVKLADGLMAIKASGYRLSDIRNDEAYAVLEYGPLQSFYLTREPDEFEDVEKAGAAQAKAVVRNIEGLAVLRPSVEAGFHSLLDTYVLHSHSVYANLAACAKEGLQIAAKALKDAPYTFGFVPYVDPGAHLTFAVRDELNRVERETGKRPNILFMQNHGLIAHHEDADECLRIHKDANDRVAAAFSLSGDAFAPVALREEQPGLYCSDTPFLRAQLLSGAYSEEFLLREPLYPDQLVFLNGTFSFHGTPEEGRCTLDTAAGIIFYRMPLKEAQVVEETLTAVTFIVDAIQKAGYTVSVMGEAARQFIANWESEQYRKALAAKK